MTVPLGTNPFSTGRGSKKPMKRAMMWLNHQFLICFSFPRVLRGIHSTHPHTFPVTLTQNERGFQRVFWSISQRKALKNGWPLFLEPTWLAPLKLIRFMVLGIHLVMTPPKDYLKFEAWGMFEVQIYNIRELEHQSKRTNTQHRTIL